MLCVVMIEIVGDLNWFGIMLDWFVTFGFTWFDLQLDVLAIVERVVCLVL